MKLKICGMKYPDNILDVSMLEPDFLGFIFWKKSPRYFDGVIPELSKSIQKVGVFVDSSLEEIIAIVNKYDLDFVQLHGKESTKFCNELKSKGVKIIKAFSIDLEFDFNILYDYESSCDHFLFDTKGKLPGGNGTTFDWNILNQYKLNKPFFLSGGIGLEEIASINEFQKQAISRNCIAIDVNSKFESKPGLKMEKKLYNFKKYLNEN